jgi:hypothetical protein
MPTHCASATSEICRQSVKKPKGGNAKSPLAEVGCGLSILFFSGQSTFKRLIMALSALSVDELSQ